MEKFKAQAAAATPAAPANVLTTLAASHGREIHWRMPVATLSIIERSHLPELSVADFSAFSVSAWFWMSKLTILRYQKTRRLFSLADQLRSMRPASAAAPYSTPALADPESRGSSRSHAESFGSHTSAQAWASEFRIVKFPE